jgi:hypothetical protein
VPERHQRGEEPLPEHQRYLMGEVDEAQAELEANNPAVRATIRLQDECPDPNVTFRLADKPIDLTGWRRILTGEGCGRWVPRR